MEVTGNISINYQCFEHQTNNKYADTLIQQNGEKL